MKRTFKLLSYLIISLLTLVFIYPGFRYKFYMLGQRWAFILILSAGVTFLMTPLFRFLAWKLQILDVPDKRKAHNGPTPLLGGLSIYIGFIISLGFYAIFSQTLLALLIAGTIVLAGGLLDDFKGASAIFRLILQIAAVGIVIWNGIHFVFLPNPILEIPLFVYD